MTQRILIIRRDNIGDLICTTPMISMLRQQYPDAEIDVLVNSYNSPVLENNPEVSQVFEYTKGKHRKPGQSLTGVYLDKFKLFWQLRRKHYDFAILPSGGFNKRGLSFARLIGARQILGYIDDEDQKQSGLTIALDARPLKGLHEAQFCAHLLTALDIQDKIPPVRLYVSAAERDAAMRTHEITEADLQQGIIGLHISARKPSNRWPEQSHVKLIHELWEQEQKPIALFWSPGPSDHPQHPGDDELAQRILSACQAIRVIPMKTGELRELVAGLSLCQTVICSDGGAMHVAAGLGKPIVCLFGDSDSKRWHPWGVPYRLLQRQDRRASAVKPEEVTQAYSDLMHLQAHGSS